MQRAVGPGGLKHQNSDTDVSRETCPKNSSTDKNPFDLATPADLLLRNRQSLADWEEGSVVAHPKVTTAGLCMNDS